MTALAKGAGVHEQVLPRRNQRYTIAIPASYTGEDATPLILVLHWGGVVTPFYGKSILAYLAEPALRELDAIVVAPDCQHGDWTNPQAESEIHALLEYLADNYNVATDKTVLMGYSKGGMGTWYLAARNQVKFAAAIPMAGYPQPDSANVHWEIPLYVIHSRRDEIVPFEQTAQVVDQLREQGVAVEFVLLDDVTHYDTGQFVKPLRAAVPWIKNVWAEK